MTASIVIPAWLLLVDVVIYLVLIGGWLWTLSRYRLLVRGVRAVFSQMTDEQCRTLAGLLHPDDPALRLRLERLLLGWRNNVHGWLRRTGS